jgi:hypothetical protein
MSSEKKGGFMNLLIVAAAVVLLFVAYKIGVSNQKQPEPIVFGLEKAKVIYNKTNGRYDGDGSKAVPFTMMATAELLGAQVTVKEECAEAIDKLNTNITETEGIIKSAEEKLIGFNKAKTFTQEVQNFFTV